MASFVQSTKGSIDPGTSYTMTWGSNTTSGNTIIVATLENSGSPNRVSSITDSQSNKYVQLKDYTPGGGGFGTDYSIWMASNITGGVTPTITVNVAASLRATGIAFEVTGSTNKPPQSLFLENERSGSSTTQVTNTVGAASSNGFMLASFSDSAVAGATTVDSAWSNYTQQDGAGGSFMSLGLAFLAINSTSVTTSAKFTTTNALFSAAMIIMVFDCFSSTINNYQFVKAGDGISVSEKIR